MLPQKAAVEICFILLLASFVLGCQSESDSPKAMFDTALAQPSLDGGILDMASLLDATALDALGVGDVLVTDPSLDAGMSDGATDGPSADGQVSGADSHLIDVGVAKGDASVMPAPIPRKVLFIGNSFTFWHDGLDSHMEAMRASVHGAGPFRADQVTRGGASLEVMWNETNARNRIERGNYDVVILQEDIPETNVESFHVYARLFAQAVRAAGAQPLLYMAWDYRRLNWISMDEIADAHHAIAEELDIPVAPAGLAWKRAQRERPRLNMYDDDDEHPSIHGTFLNASTIYAVLFGENPEGLSYRPAQAGGVSDEEAAFLQRIAWAEVQAR